MTSDNTNGTEPSMTAPIFEPDTTTRPAKPRRNRLWAVAAVLLAVALAGGAALYAATRSSGDGPAAAPAAPSPAASSDPAPAPTPSDTPTTAAPAPAPAPATPEEAARADLLALPGRQAAAADQAFVDQTGDPNTYFDPVSAGPLYQDWMKRVLGAHSGGTVYLQRTTTIHSTEVTALDLAGRTATVRACETLTANGTRPDGSPGSVNEPRSLMTYTATKGEDGAWRFIARDSDDNNSC